MHHSDSLCSLTDRLIYHPEITSIHCLFGDRHPPSSSPSSSMWSWFPLPCTSKGTVLCELRRFSWGNFWKTQAGFRKSWSAKQKTRKPMVQEEKQLMLPQSLLLVSCPSSGLKAVFSAMFGLLIAWMVSPGDICLSSDGGSCWEQVYRFHQGWDKSCALVLPTSDCRHKLWDADIYLTVTTAWVIQSITLLS